MLVDVVMLEETAEAWVYVDGEGQVYDLPAVRPYLPPELRTAMPKDYVLGCEVNPGAPHWEWMWVFSLPKPDENASVTRRTCERPARRPRTTTTRLCRRS